jgi:ribosomal protein S18 acetylase RimI-like enzyme
MLASSYDLLSATFGTAAPAVLHRDFLRGTGIFGYAHQLVGEVDGQLVVTMTAYDGRLYRRLSRHTLRSVTLAAPRRLGTVLRRTVALSGLFIPPAPDSLFLANLCVAPDQRDHGYGSQLVTYACAVARDRALAAVELDVSFSNMRAQRLYERLGFVVTGERPAPDGSGLDGFRRMRRESGPASGSDA